MDSPPFLTAAWRYLAMLNFEVSPALLRPLVPAGTELDPGAGVTLASLVGFRFLDTRVLGIAVPGHRDFDEVNLRFYVRRQAEDGAWMRHELEVVGATEGAPARVAYAWRLGGRWHRLEVRTHGVPLLPAPGSEAAFITEHYWGYTRRRDGGTAEYRVAHVPWRVWRAADTSLDGDMAHVYGAGFAECLRGPPRSAFLAEGSTVTVSGGRRIPARPRQAPGVSFSTPG